MLEKLDYFAQVLLQLPTPTIFAIVFFVLLGCGFGVPIPEDFILFLAGLVCYENGINVWVMVLLCLGGVIIGDATIFLLGAKYGQRLTRIYMFRRFLTHDRLERVKKKLHKHGNKVIFAARFMPGLRASIFFTSGTLHLPFRVFFFYDGLAALLSVPAIVLTVHHFGDELDAAIKGIRKVENGILIFITSILVLAFLKWLWGKVQARKGDSI